MRKSLVQGTKADVRKRRAIQKELISAAYRECAQMIEAGVNPYAAIVVMDTKLTRIVTFNHSWVMPNDQ